MDLLQRMKDECDKAGMWMEAFRMDSGYIVLKDPSDQDKKLDQICENIRKAAQVDVHIISQHRTMVPIRRNGTAPGRGDAVYTTFKLENDWKSLPEGMAGHVTYDEYWERITKFLKRVIPVCEEYKVALANHPYDPPGLPLGYEGVENFDSPSIYTAYKKYEEIVDSLWNCFQLDLGVIGKGSTDVNKTEPPLVQYLAERGKINRPLVGRDEFYVPIGGFDSTANNYDFRVENRGAGIGLHVTADQPPAHVSMWSIRSVLAVEPYISFVIPPGQTVSWSYTYTYSRL